MSVDGGDVFNEVAEAILAVFHKSKHAEGGGYKQILVILSVATDLAKRIGVDPKMLLACVLVSESSGPHEARRVLEHAIRGASDVARDKAAETLGATIIAKRAQGGAP